AEGARAKPTTTKPIAPTIVCALILIFSNTNQIPFRPYHSFSGRSNPVTTSLAPTNRLSYSRRVHGFSASRFRGGESVKQISFRVVLSILFCGSVTHAADRLRIAYSSISGAYTGIWVAHDAGFFSKEGLEDQIILIPSATQLAQVTVAGDVDIAS